MLMDDFNAGSSAPITTVPKHVSGPDHDVSDIGGFVSSRPVELDGGDPCPLDRPQPGAQTSQQSFPGQDMDLSKTIFGLPPCGIENLKDPILLGAFYNSFPILTIRPIKAVRPENSQGVTTTQYLAEPYKFAIKTDGSAGYNITNEYGPSMIEEAFTNMVQLDSISQLIQFIKTNRSIGKTADDISNKIQENFGDKLKTTRDELDVIVSNAQRAASSNELVQDVAKAVSSFGSAALNGIFRGHKIDIPNIWKGSSSIVSQQATIVLHCFDVNVDSEFQSKVILPLQILLKMASPYATVNKSSSDGGDANEIITYENPPYVEASVDGLFRTKLGAITDMTVTTNFMDQALCKGGRPTIITVNLTISDLYNAIIWTDEEHPYAPNGMGITNFLMEHDRDEAVIPIDVGSEFCFMPDGGADESSQSIKPWRSGFRQSSNPWSFNGAIGSGAIENGSNWLSNANINDINFSQELNINTSNVNVPSDVYNAWNNNAFLNTDSNGNLFTDGPTAYSMSILNDKQYTEIANQEVQYTAPTSYGGYMF